MKLHVDYVEGLARVLDAENKIVGTMQSFKGIDSYAMAENVVDILSIKAPRHQIDVGASPHYIPSDYGFEIRINDSGVIGEDAKSTSFSIDPAYQDTLKGRFTPDFFIALCDAMPAPEKSKRIHTPSTPVMS